jgi:hypothetical protein
VLSLRYIQTDSDGGITRAQQLEAIGAQPPWGSHLGFVQISKGPIFSPTDTGSVYEVRVHCLRQIPGRSEEFSHKSELSSLVAVVV